MADWPSDLPTAGRDFEQMLHRPSIRSRSDAGYLVSRPLWTATKREFKLKWKALTNSQVEQIETFFDNIGWGGTEFNFTSPVDSTTYAVKLMDDEMKVKYIAEDKFEVKLTFMEV